eukprot:488858-Rhodomonas_salina.2
MDYFEIPLVLSREKLLQPCCSVLQHCDPARISDVCWFRFGLPSFIDMLQRDLHGHRSSHEEL